ncbi:MAG TPA: hypothetical protein VMW91_09740 [Desulfosporosinus sp.]|nr:hypothetical protein [Desulfosporosinus sp.]
MEIVILAIVAVVAFVAGVLVGRNNAARVEKLVAEGQGELSEAIKEIKDLKAKVEAKINQ